jgi:hypothetical protein
MDQRDKNTGENNSQNSSENNTEPENDGIDESEIDFTARVAPATGSKMAFITQKSIESRTSLETPPRLSNPDFSKLTLDQLMRSSVAKNPQLSPRSAIGFNRVVGKMVRPEISYDHKEEHNTIENADLKERSVSAENLPMTVEMRRASNSSGYFPGFRHQKVSYSCDFENDNPSQTSMFNRDYSKAKRGLESVGRS